MANLALFYHVWSPPHTQLWRFLVDEQLKRIARNGIHNVCDIYCCAAGEQQGDIARYLEIYPWITAVIKAGNDSHFEEPTLSWLSEECKRGNDLIGVCYIHTKGMGKLSDNIGDRGFRALNSWRHFLEWGVLDRWRSVLALLPNYDVIGVNYRQAPWPHMSGNFWWSRPDYVRRLCSPISTPIDDLWPIEGNPKSRHLYEKWIGTGQPKVFSFYTPPYRDNGVIIGANKHWGLDLYVEDIEPYYRHNSL
jgi:hypothetical protein